VDVAELVFAQPVEVIGRGTFGFVIKADFRGTTVAVKRVLPPRGATVARAHGGSSSGTESRDATIESTGISKPSRRSSGADMFGGGDIPHIPLLVVHPAVAPMRNNPPPPQDAGTRAAPSVQRCTEQHLGTALHPPTGGSISILSRLPAPPVDPGGAPMQTEVMQTGGFLQRRAARRRHARWGSGRGRMAAQGTPQAWGPAGRSTGRARCEAADTNSCVR